MADPLGVKSHSDTDLKRTMHTNEIITNFVGGLWVKKDATAQLPQSFLLRHVPGKGELRLINLLFFFFFLTVCVLCHFSSETPFPFVSV